MREILKLIHEHASHHPSVTNRLQGSPPILPSRSRRSFSCSCSTARPSPHRHSACWASRFVERSLPTLRQSAVDDRRCHCFASLRYLEQQLEPAVERRAPPRMVFPPTARAILNQGPSAKLLALLETPLRQARQLLLLSVLGAEWPHDCAYPPQPSPLDSVHGVGSGVCGQPVQSLGAPTTFASPVPRELLVRRTLSAVAGFRLVEWWHAPQHAPAPRLTLIPPPPPPPSLHPGVVTSAVLVRVGSCPPAVIAREPSPFRPPTDPPFPFFLALWDTVQILSRDL